MTTNRGLRQGLAAGAAVFVLLGAGLAAAQTRSFSLPSEEAVKAIPAFAQQAGVQIIAPARQLRGVRTPALSGSYEVREALQRLLQGTGLEIASDAGGVITLRSAAGPQAAGLGGGTPAEVGELVVTGTRIRGEAPSSPVIELNARDIRESGLTSTGDVIRDIPQNFAGGQNPGVIGGASGRNLSNQNISSASSLDLRGLGPDATLTLLNGKRLSYDGFSQAVDVSLVPLPAIAQIQVLTDGASAIYGSDAVAGVANIILKHDLDGGAASVRYAGATEGGDVQEEGTLVLGHTWTGGGVIVAGSSTHQSAIMADQRDYTADMLDPSTLLPSITQYSALLSGHQDLGDKVTVGLDAIWSKRKSKTYIADPGVYYFYGNLTSEYAVSPSITVKLPHDWSATAYGTLARDHVQFDEPEIDAAGQVVDPYHGCYCDSSKQVEGDAEGPLFQLPGGAARLALGAGWRRNSVNADDLPGARSSTYGFGELSLPLVSPEMDVPGVARLSLNGALRYERYTDIGHVTTPKIGLVYAPVADVELKGSWGRSFKAPTLLQQHQAQYVAVFPASSFGPGQPADAQALLIGGGRLDLSPEKAKTTSATVAWKPHQAPGLQLEATWFHIDYRDRVVAPIATFGQAFVDPGYARYVTYNPTAAVQQALIAGADPFYSVGPVYDASKVVAIVDNAFTNVARQKISGVDLSGRYSHAVLGGEGQLIGSASWLKETQKIAAGEAATPLAGLLFFPPRFRARAGAVWSGERLTLAGYVNHQSGLTNRNTTPWEHVDSQTTVDANLLWRFGDGAGVLNGVEAGLAVQNLFNAEPPYVTPLADYIAPIDSNNYSVVGRFVSLTLTKRW